VKNADSKPKPDSAAFSGVKSIHNAIRLLRAVVTRNEFGAGLNELAKEVGLHVATARRMLKALVQEGLLMYNAETRLYHLGLELNVLGSAARQFRIRDQARPILEQLAQDTEDMVYLGLRSGNDVLVIDKVEGAFPIRALTQEIGMRLPLGIGSGSLAILAFSPDPEVKRILRANQRRFPKYNKRSARWVKDQIPLVRERGYAVSEGNIIAGAAAVGAPILNASGKAVAAISVSAIAQRMDQARQERIARLLMDEIASVDWDYIDET